MKANFLITGVALQQKPHSQTRGLHSVIDQKLPKREKRERWREGDRSLPSTAHWGQFWLLDANMSHSLSRHPTTSMGIVTLLRKSGWGINSTCYEKEEKWAKNEVDKDLLFSLKVTDGPGEQFAFWVYSRNLCHHKHLEIDEFGTLRILLQMSFSSVQFSCSVVSDSLRPHGLQYTRPPRPSLTPRVCETRFHIYALIYDICFFLFLTYFTI